MQRYRLALIVGAIFLGVFALSYVYMQFRGDDMLSADLGETASPPPPAMAPTPVEPHAAEPPGGEPTAQNAPPLSESEDMASLEPGAGSGPSAMPPAAAADPPAPGAPPDYAPPAGGAAPPPLAEFPPAAHDPPPPPPPPPAAPAHMPPPPGAFGGAPPPVPIAPAAPPPAYTTGPGSGPSAVPPRPSAGGSRVLSYFQKTRTPIDTSKAFGFVLIPKAAITTEEKKTQKQFCEIMLATMDFMTPGAVAEVAAQREILATYWPVVTSRESFEIKAAFSQRNCDELIAWYDHAVARSLAAKAGVAGLSGPLLITWPSSGANEQDRNPLIVDFSRADYAHANKALQYWFQQLRNRPDLWTNRIREGTIRAELADAVNDTAGVVLAVLHGKWDSINAVGAAAP